LEAGSRRPSQVSSVLRLHVLHALSHRLPPRILDGRRKVRVAVAHRIDQRVDEWRIERGIHVELPPTVSLGDPAQDRWFPRRLLWEDEQQAERMPQELMLALELRKQPAWEPTILSRIAERHSRRELDV